MSVTNPMAANTLLEKLLADGVKIASGEVVITPDETIPTEDQALKDTVVTDGETKVVQVKEMHQPTNYPNDKLTSSFDDENNLINTNPKGKIAGEVQNKDWMRICLAVFSPVRITSSSSVSSGITVCGGITIEPVASGVVEVYDGANDSGVLKYKHTWPATLLNDAPTTVLAGAIFTDGCYIKLATISSVTALVA